MYKVHDLKKSGVSNNKNYRNKDEQKDESIVKGVRKPKQSRKKK